MEVIPFEPDHATKFKELNEAWLMQHFYIEEKDREILENCEEYIINRGGFIFFASIDNEIIGCFSLIKIEDKVYELGKMAVDSKHQGKKIGQKLMEFAIDFAKAQLWKRIILYSHRKLTPAIYIYRKYGFVEIPLEKNTPYIRSNIKMELVL